jgi:hypothetical protein
MKLKLIMLGIFCFGLTFSAQAQTATPKVSKRQVNQTKRIKQGVHSGELTRGETAALKSQQRSINRTKRRAKADGNVTKKERAIIHTRQNRANKNIARKKHNGRN